VETSLTSLVSRLANTVHSTGASRLVGNAVLAADRARGFVRARPRRIADGSAIRVLAHVPGYPPERNAGSEIALHRVLRDLRRRGHEIQVLSPGVSRDVDGIRVIGDGGSCRQLYDWSDVVVTQLGARRRALRLAARHDRPLVLFLHLGGLDPKSTYGKFSLVVFAASWLRTAKPWGGPAMVLHIPVDAEQYEATPGDSITLVGLSELKGAPIFFELARRFPERPFLGVRGAWGEQMEPSVLPDNVKILDNTPDMRSVYGRTRILLMPSRFEVFPRVCREAALSGIPVIATPCDGVREALGDAALYAPRNDVDSWVSHVLSLDDPTVYGERSDRVREFVAQQDFTAELDEFAERLVRIAARVD
jgi:glycosyltransferase involved in cell wall biosynthesis